MGRVPAVYFFSVLRGEEIKRWALRAGRGKLQDCDDVGVDVTCKACGCAVLTSNVEQSAEEGTFCLRLTD